MSNKYRCRMCGVVDEKETHDYNLFEKITTCMYCSTPVNKVFELKKGITVIFKKRLYVKELNYTYVNEGDVKKVMDVKAGYVIFDDKLEVEKEFVINNCEEV